MKLREAECFATTRVSKLLLPTADKIKQLKRRYVLKLHEKLVQ